MGDVGKTVDDDEIELIEIDLDWHAPSPAPSAATSSEPARPIWRRALAFDPRWLILVAVVVYVGWFLTSNGGDDEAAPPSPSTAPTSASTTPPAETVTTEDDRAALGGDPSLDLAAAIETLVAADYDTSYLEMQVNPNGVDVFAVIKDFDTVPGGFRFAYIGVDGRPVVIDTEAGELRSLVTEAPLEGDAGFVDGTGFAVLPDRDGILGLDRSRPDQAWRVGADMSVVRRHTGELFGVRETDAGVEYGLVDDPDGWETLPAGAEFWIEPSVGVFLVPASGGVFELTPDGVESVTPFEMLTTSGTRWIERRRIEGPNEHWVVDRSGEEWDLRVDQPSRPWSPAPGSTAP